MPQAWNSFWFTECRRSHEKRGGVSFPLLLDFSVSGYFWPVPDTGNWPVQLKHLQMTLSFGFNAYTRSSFSFSGQIHISLYWLLPQFAITRALLFDQCKGGGREGESEGQCRLWRDRIKPIKIEKRGKKCKRKILDASFTRVCELLFLYGKDVTTSRGTEWERGVRIAK